MAILHSVDIEPLAAEHTQGGLSGRALGTGSTLEVNLTRTALREAMHGDADGALAHHLRETVMLAWVGAIVGTAIDALAISREGASIVATTGGGWTQRSPWRRDRRGRRLGRR